MDLNYTISSGYPGGFVADAFGYMCFIIPQVAGQSVEWRWIIQSGGGWSGNDGDELVTQCEGIAISSIDAEKHIIEKLENNLNVNKGQSGNSRHKLTVTVLQNRQDLALVTRIITWLAGLYIAWHAVLFCQGEIGSLGLWLSDAILLAVGEPPMDFFRNPAYPMGILVHVFGPTTYYVTGISGWVTPGLLVIHFGELIANWLDRTCRFPHKPLGL